MDYFNSTTTITIFSTKKQGRVWLMHIAYIKKTIYFFFRFPGQNSIFLGMDTAAIYNRQEELTIEVCVDLPQLCDKNTDEDQNFSPRIRLS